MPVAESQSPPFLTVASDDVIAVEPWRTGDGDPLPKMLVDWDPATDIACSTRVSIDGEALCAECDLEPQTTLRIGAAWMSSRTRLRGAGTPVTATPGSGGVSASPVLEVPGALVGGTLHIDTVIAIEQAAPASQIAATDPGQVLWEDRQSVLLEGSAPRFPVSVVDFSGAGVLHPQAAWVLDWQSVDYAEPFGAGLSLLINENRPDVVRAIRTDSEEPGAAATRSRIYLDVARSLITRALSDEEFLDSPEGYEQGSVGRVVLHLIDIAWPGLSARAARTRMLGQPTRFESELQGNFLIERE